jgi:hypothetical protein
LDIHKRTIINESKSTDLNRTSNNESKFKFISKKGAGIGGMAKRTQGCICLNIQKSEGHSIKVGST